MRRVHRFLLNPRPSSVRMRAMNLGQWMHRQGLTDGEVGVLIGRSASTINRLRRGVTRPDWPTMIRLREATDGRVKPNDFIQPAEHRGAA